MTAFNAGHFKVIFIDLNSFDYRMKVVRGEKAYKNEEFTVVTREIKKMKAMGINLAKDEIFV